MDRFIVATPFDFSTSDLDLKSNMDRFIEDVDNLFTDLKNNLKSNMDRFIAEEFILLNKIFQGFKIQYG